MTYDGSNDDGDSDEADDDAEVLANVSATLDRFDRSASSGLVCPCGFGAAAGVSLRVWGRCHVGQAILSLDGGAETGPQPI